MDRAFFEFASGGRPRLDLDQPRLTLGRASANDVQLDDGTVSGQHAAIEWQPDGWTIRDLGSSNGIHVNGRRIDQPLALNPGDKVRLGHTELVFRIAGTVLLPDTPAPASGYLDVTEEWAPPGSPARPAPAPARAAADRKPAAAPIHPYNAQAAGAAQVPANDPLGARRNGGFAQVRGVARNVHQEAQNQARVLIFRIERYDPSGNRLSPAGVEFRGYKSGQLSDGEEVEVIGSWKRGTLRASKVTNLTTHAQIVGPTVVAKAATRLFVTIFIIVWCSIALFIIAALLSGL